MQWLRNLFGFKEEKKVHGYTIVADNMGFPDIKIGDKFEGAGCGHWFSDQVCTGFYEGNVIGTTTLSIFRKENIRPVKEENTPPKWEHY